MALILKKKKHASEDSDQPKKKLKLPKAVVNGENEDDESTLAHSRPFTAKDRRKVLKGTSAAGLNEKSMVKKAKARMADPEDDELDEEEIAELVSRAKKTLARYGGVSLTPKNKHTAGLRKDGLRVAKYRVPAGDANDMVRVVMMRRVDPAPRIGNVNVLTDHGHAVLEKGETYQLPRVVAMHLMECKAGTMIDD